MHDYKLFRGLADRLFGLILGNKSTCFQPVAWLQVTLCPVYWQKLCRNHCTGHGYFPTDEKDFGHKGFNLKLVGAGRGGWGRVRQTLDVVQNAPNQDRGW